MTELSRLSLFPATSQQLEESRKGTFEQWARGLSLQQYLERDRWMESLEYARCGKLITWVLAPIDDPFTLDFMCSCETFRRIGIASRMGPDGQAVVEEVPCYGIASVFTSPSKRKNGYAAHMMSLLHWVLAPDGAIAAPFPVAWGSPPVARLQDAAFSVLYSDIGDTFYHHNCSCIPDQKLGWVTTGAISTTWQVRRLSAGHDRGHWIYLDKDDTACVWDEDVQEMKEDARKAAAVGSPACHFLPDKGVGRMSIERVMRFDPDHALISPLKSGGIRLASEGEGSALVYATWSLENMISKKMVLTRLRASKAWFPTLLTKIMEFAVDNGLEAVETWNIPMELVSVAADLGGETFERKEHLPSIKWYGAEPEEKVQWLFNEKFCWC